MSSFIIDNYWYNKVYSCTIFNGVLNLTENTTQLERNSATRTTTQEFMNPRPVKDSGAKQNVGFVNKKTVCFVWKKTGAIPQQRNACFKRKIHLTVEMGHLIRRFRQKANDSFRLHSSEWSLSTCTSIPFSLRKRHSHNRFTQNEWSLPD